MEKQLSAVAAILAFLVAALAPASGQAPPHVIEVARIVLPAEDNAGKKVEEVSGLAWDADDGLLYAVSDDGKLFHLRFGGDLGPNLKASVVKTVKLGGGNALRNAEGLAALNGANGIKGDGRLLVAFEDGPALQVHTPDGTLLTTVDVPLPLRDTARYQTKNDGIESVAIGAGHGVLVAPELPLQNLAPDYHMIYGSRGRTIGYERMRGARAPTGRIKAISLTLDGSLYVLERHRDDATLEYISVIRRIGNCDGGGAERCKALTFADPGQSLRGLPFEGMTFLDETTAVIAADVKKSEGQTVLVVVRLLPGKP